MSDIKIPSWTLPIAAGIIPAAIAWGTMQAQAEATAEDISRISVVVEKVQEESGDNTKSTALNAQAITSIADSLARQEKIQAASDARVAHLVQLLLEQTK